MLVFTSKIAEVSCFLCISLLDNEMVTIVYAFTLFTFPEMVKQTSFFSFSEESYIFLFWVLHERQPYGGTMMTVRSSDVARGMAQIEERKMYAFSWCDSDCWIYPDMTTMKPPRMDSSDEFLAEVHGDTWRV
ncbi:hypothetical protein GQ457_06G013280 [Hibiscus cannabinus]